MLFYYYFKQTITKGYKPIFILLRKYLYDKWVFYVLKYVTVDFDLQKKKQYKINMKSLEQLKFS